MTKNPGWILKMIAAIGVSAYALVQGFAPGLRGGFVENMVMQTPLAAVLHFVGGGIVLLAGASQFHAGIRARHPRFHRDIRASIAALGEFTWAAVLMRSSSPIEGEISQTVKT